MRIQKKQLCEIVKYGWCGAVTTALNLALFVTLTICKWDYILANSFSYVIAVVVNYWLNMQFVFTSCNKKQTVGAVRFIKFIVVRGIMLALDNALFFTLTEIAGIPLYVGRILLTAFFIFLTYSLNKRFVFEK